MKHGFLWCLRIFFGHNKNLLLVYGKLKNCRKIFTNKARENKNCAKEVLKVESWCSFFSITLSNNKCEEVTKIAQNKPCFSIRPNFIRCILLSSLLSCFLFFSPSLFFHIFLFCFLHLCHMPYYFDKAWFSS